MTIRAFLRRDTQLALSYRAPLVLEVTTAIFILANLSFVSRLVSQSRVPGADFFTYVAIGLAVTAFLQAGLSVLASNFRQEQVQGTLEGLVATGVPVGRLAVGMAAFPMTFAALRVVVYVITAALLGGSLSGGNWALAVAGIALGAVSFGGLGLVAAAVVVTIRQAQGAVGLLVAGLGLAGGALFPPDLLPSWLQTLAQASPFTHALELSRRALLENASWEASLGRLGILAGLAVAYSLVGILALKAALVRARRRGNLGEY